MVGMNKFQLRVSGNKVSIDHFIQVLFIKN